MDKKEQKGLFFRIREPFLSLLLSSGRSCASLFSLKSFSNGVKLNLAFCLIFFIQGCIPLAYPFKEAIPSKIRAQGEAEAYFHLEDPRQVHRLAAKAAYSDAMFNLMRKIEDLYITPRFRIGTILEKNPQIKLEVLNLVNQARIRKTRFLQERKIMVELELNGNMLREALSPYR